MEELKNKKYLLNTLLFLFIDLGFLLYTLVKLHIFQEILIHPENVILVYGPAIYLAPLSVLLIIFKMGNFPGIKTPITKLDVQFLKVFFLLVICAIISHGIGISLGLFGFSVVEYWVGGLTFVMYAWSYPIIFILVVYLNSRRKNKLWQKIKNHQEKVREENAQFKSLMI